ncbi:MAG: tRNA (adenosine(37)-N6)-threonylcarbamoyltransferase complex ATPase subunit type 1 TsaE [Pseudomonadota bacterium]
MKTGSFTTASEKETQNLAQECATAIQQGDIILLQGPLGAGKSVFARALINALSNQHDDIPSPTFTLVQEYETPKGMFYHFDLYRIEEPEEIYELGWEDIVNQEIAVVEWPEKLGFLRPNSYIEIIIQPLNESKRSVTITDKRKSS